MKTAVVGLQRDSNELVAVEINELDVSLCEMRLEASSLHYKLGVALVPRTFADCDVCRPETEETSRGRADEHLVGVDGFRQILHKIRLEEDRFAGNIQPEQPQSI